VRFWSVMSVVMVAKRFFHGETTDMEKWRFRGP
jgi:hypothetical protein